MQPIAKKKALHLFTASALFLHESLPSVQTWELYAYMFIDLDPGNVVSFEFHQTVLITGRAYFPFEWQYSMVSINTSVGELALLFDP